MHGGRWFPGTRGVSGLAVIERNCDSYVAKQEINPRLETVLLVQEEDPLCMSRASSSKQKQPRAGDKECEMRVLRTGRWDILCHSTSRGTGEYPGSNRRHARESRCLGEGRRKWCNSERGQRDAEMSREKVGPKGRIPVSCIDRVKRLANGTEKDLMKGDAKKYGLRTDRDQGVRCGEYNASILQLSMPTILLTSTPSLSAVYGSQLSRSSLVYTKLGSPRSSLMPCSLPS
jgi:hypothetical protein